MATFFLVSQVRPEPGAAAEIGAEEWDKTFRGAEQEGKLTLYLWQSDDIEKVALAFQNKYPKIKLTVVAARGELASRIMAERRAGKYLADVAIAGPTAPYYLLYKNKALDPIAPALILPEVLDRAKWWSGKHHYMDPEGKHIFVFIGTVASGRIFYHTNFVAANEFQSYSDLLRPMLRGKILSIDPRISGAQRVGVRTLYHIPELGPKFIRRLYGEMETVLSRDSRQAVDWLATGKFPLCLFCTDARNAKRQGLPVDELKTTDWIERPALSSGSNGTLVLMNQAPHPNAAKVFINWLLSREGQIAYQEIMNAPDSSFESMRIDVPKDRVPLADRRKEGVKYVVMDTPERADQEPVDKLLNEILKR